ncbi:MAG: hypothetical protein JWQ43_3183, partial [Glaciihabitans sp.]|nr:hypothetical protein [Glaciihabitans sp.]
LAVIGAVLLQKGVTQLVRAQLAFREAAAANGPTLSSTSIRVVALNRIVFALLSLAVCLLLAVSHIIGAVTPTPEFDPGNISAESRERPQPAPPAPDPLADPSLPSPYVPDPVTAPQVVTSLSTYYTLAELTAAMQFLVDSSMDTAGPIDDPSIPPGTRVPVNANGCTVDDETGLQLSLDVHFNTVDDAAGLERVRELWAGYGYELYDRADGTDGATLDPASRVDARGDGRLPGNSLALRTSEDNLVLTVSSICINPL